MLELNIIEVVNTMIKTGLIYSKTSVFSFNVKNYVMDPRNPARYTNAFNGNVHA